MKLVCPHCSKVVDVDETQAGQTVNCNLCSGPFTVPAGPAAPPPSAPPPLPPFQPSPAPSQNPFSNGPRIPAPPPPPPSPDLSKGPSASVLLPNRDDSSPPPPPPRDLPRGPSKFEAAINSFDGVFATFGPYRAYVILALLFLCLFFGWVGIQAGNSYYASQSGFGVAFGSVKTPEGKDFTTFAGKVSAAALIIFLFLTCLVGLAALVVELLLEKGPPGLQQNLQGVGGWLRNNRVMFGMGLVCFAFFLLLLHLLMPFPLESAAGSKDNVGLVKAIIDKNIVSEAPVEFTLKNADFMNQWLYRGVGYYLSLLIALLGVCWTVLPFLANRGVIPGTPRVGVRWVAPR